MLLMTVVTIPVLAVGCANSNNSPEPALYFPVQKEPQTVVLEALLSGKLVVDDGYLRVNGHLILWPHGYSWQAENNEIWILNDEGQKVARVGESVRLGGGVMPTSIAEEKIGQKLPDGIKGPFWLMGIVKN